MSRLVVYAELRDLDASEGNQVLATVGVPVTHAGTSTHPLTMGARDQGGGLPRLESVMVTIKTTATPGGAT